MESLKGSGKYVRSIPYNNHHEFDIAVDATLRAIAIKNIQTKKSSRDYLPVINSDLRLKVRRSPKNSLIIFLVDSSESMSTKARMKSAKGAIITLLSCAYQKRYQIALVTFGYQGVKVLLNPTRSIALAREKLRKLPCGGATPFSPGLLKTLEMIKIEKIKDPFVEPVLVIISDGGANVPLRDGRSVKKEMFSLAEQIQQNKVSSLVIDTSTGNKSEEMLILSKHLRASYHHIKKLKSSNLIENVNNTN